MLQQDKNSTSDLVSYYGFRYADIVTAIMKSMPSLLETVETMKDDLLQAAGTTFVDYSIGWDFLDGTWEDPQEESAAALEITRQIIGFLTQSLPPILEENEPPFLLPHQRRKEHAQRWFDELLAYGGDDPTIEGECQVAAYLADWKAQQDT